MLARLIVTCFIATVAQAFVIWRRLPFMEQTLAKGTLPTAAALDERLSWQFLGRFVADILPTDLIVVWQWQAGFMIACCAIFGVLSVLGTQGWWTPIVSVVLWASHPITTLPLTDASSLLPIVTIGVVLLGGCSVLFAERHSGSTLLRGFFFGLGMMLCLTAPFLHAVGIGAVFLPVIIMVGYSTGSRFYARSWHAFGFAMVLGSIALVTATWQQWGDGPLLWLLVGVARSWLHEALLTPFIAGQAFARGLVGLDGGWLVLTGYLDRHFGMTLVLAVIAVVILEAYKVSLRESREEHLRFAVASLFLLPVGGLLFSGKPASHDVILLAALPGLAALGGDVVVTAFSGFRDYPNRLSSVALVVLLPTFLFVATVAHGFSTPTVTAIMPRSSVRVRLGVPESTQINVALPVQPNSIQARGDVYGYRIRDEFVRIAYEGELLVGIYAGSNGLRGPIGANTIKRVDSSEGASQ